jgi:hypothetical protein
MKKSARGAMSLYFALNSIRVITLREKEGQGEDQKFMKIVFAKT